MKEFAVTVTMKVTLEEIANLLTSALEGGSNYWYHIVKVVKPTSWEFESEPKRERGHWFQDYPLNPGGALIVGDIEDEEQEPVRLDMEAIQRGLNILAEKYPGHMSDILNENADAATGDAFLQCALFGEIIYG